MSYLYRSAFCLSLLFVSVLMYSQRLVEVINQSERAVLSVKALSLAGSTVNEGSGCVISSDGIAIITASCLFAGDSVYAESRTNRRFGIQTILQVHPLSNLALVKLNVGRTRDLPYLIPSKQTFLEGQDVVVFGSKTDLEDGVVFGRIESIRNFVYFNRFGDLSVKATAKSIGAPVINSKGEIAGIVCALDVNKPTLILDAKLLNDSNWVNVGLGYDPLRLAHQKRMVFSGELNEGLQRMLANEYEQSARALSGFIRINPTDFAAYALRSHARYMYKNTYGSKEDLAQCKKLNPNGFLPYFFEAQHCYAENKKDEALINYSLCLERKPDFAYALVENGRLLYAYKRNLESAYSNFLAAIAADSTYGAGYYEKARFVLQHFEDKRSADKDIDNAIRLDPNLPGVYVIRGTMRIESQNYLPAISDFDKAVEKDKNDMHALFNRGIAEYNLGMKDKACKDWQNAANMGHFKAVKYISRYCTSGNR